MKIKGILLIAAMGLAIGSFVLLESGGQGGGTSEATTTPVQPAQAPSTPSAVLVRPHSPSYGAADAKVRIVEFFDPSCEACRAFYPFVKKLVDAHPGKVQLVIRYAAFHRGSDQAVRVLEAARLQGVFWQVLEAALAQQDTWAAHGNPKPELIWGFVDHLWPDKARARADAASAQAGAVLEQDTADTNGLRIERTPTFFVNGKPLGEFGPTQLTELVQREVATAYPSK